MPAAGTPTGSSLPLHGVVGALPISGVLSNGDPLPQPVYDTKHNLHQTGLKPNTAYVNTIPNGREAEYLGAATNINPRNTQALTLLGRAGLQRKDYAAARSALERAVLEDGDNWQPHNLLADTYLHQGNYDRARDEAHVAIEKGKAQASPAELVLGEALVNLGQDKEGVEALNRFLDEMPRHPMAR